MGRHTTYAFETYRAVADAGRAELLAATTSPFQIEVRFVGGLTSGQRDVFAQAAERWARVIVGDLETAILRDFTGDVVIDDLLIDAEGVVIDGVFGTLGEAGPIRFRRETAATGARLPATGIMRFDKADLGQMEDDGSLLDVITHEMGHVLGIGTIWDTFGLLKDFPGPNPTFVGPGAMKEFGTLIGAGQPTPVPVANVGGAGSAGGHWRERVFGNELMSPTIGGPGNPLSRLTVASLGDLGYQVDLDAAEPYALPDPFVIAMAGGGESAPPRGVMLPTVPSSIPADRP
ncbi:leishmanolysin-related zinc metalloendopeptidase [Streptomyces virginiae]|uniref:leishmanolysin-related zinc metalloendopeptidase n=1 Tax=Streptomyces virginiae TaxID=1961 RepID=UPI002251C4FE|nr:leishmanolysin-related zinc metalloendopeptidase [Streptomyces virginiae]MCX4958194.1 leishmanolysin [Streptomyces virginiae]MCX5177019.1 leishmanolysin [Streptomyces virginiae]